MIETPMEDVFYDDSEDTAGYCVYHLIKNNKVVYVGQSKCLKKRVIRHCYSEIDFDFVGIIKCDESDVSNMEASQIVKHLPPLNKNLPKNDIYMPKKIASNKISEYISDRIIEIKSDYVGSRSEYIKASKIEKLIELIDTTVSDFVKKGE